MNDKDLTGEGVVTDNVTENVPQPDASVEGRVDLDGTINNEAPEPGPDIPGPSEVPLEAQTDTDDDLLSDEVRETPDVLKIGSEIKVSCTKCGAISELPPEAAYVRDLQKQPKRAPLLIEVYVCSECGCFMKVERIFPAPVYEGVIVD